MGTSKQCGKMRRDNHKLHTFQIVNFNLIKNTTINGAKPDVIHTNKK